MAPQIVYWEPEDRAFWAREGARVARRNLLVSAPALVVAFAVWMMWSVVVVQLPRIGFHFTPNQLFWLAALPGLAGGTLRLFFSFMVPMFGGRTWTTLSTAALLVPAIGLGLAVQDPSTGYPTFLLLSIVAGIGGGNFASSMANISFFYPAERKGEALGWNAGVGNLGVSLAQVAIPLAIGAALFGALGGEPQALDRRRAGAGDLAAERGLRLGAADRARRGSGVAADGRPRAGARDRGRPGDRLPAPAHLDPVVALPRQLRLVHRLRGRVAAGRRARVHRLRRHALRVRRPAARRTRPARGRLAGRPRRRCPRRARVVHG